MMPLKLKSSWWLLSACAAFAKASESESPAATTNLIQWIQSKDGGIYSSKQEEKFLGDRRGIFAAVDIDEGEILLRVPWDSIIGAEGATEEVIEAEQELQQKFEDGDIDLDVPPMGNFCRAIQALYKEAEKGVHSDFAYHLDYLSLLDGDTSRPELPMIPSIWSQEGRDLLEDINDHGFLPPFGLFTILNHDLFGSCIKDIKNNPLEAKVAAIVASHEITGEVMKKYGIIVPFFDNHYYNRNKFHVGGSSGRKRSGGGKTSRGTNAMEFVDYGEAFRLVTTRSIKKGEEIIAPFENEYTTLDYFRNYGIMEPNFFPEYYEFELPNGDLFGINVEKDEFGRYKVEIVEVGEEGFEADDIEQFFEHHVYRLRRLENLAKGKGDTMKPIEWKASWKYHSLMFKVVQATLRQLRKEYPDEFVCPGGFASKDDQCPLWDGFQYLPGDELIKDHDLEFRSFNPYGPTDSAYAMCNDEDVSDWDQYQKAGEVEMFKSQYQEIRFFANPETNDMVMKLDDTVQQCSSYRPHYHEFAVHFPARFIETVKRVLFVGGGDSMVLHEVLKYPSLERVVGLELDQYVVRNAFRYFDTQPHFDDKRVEWWFGDGAKSLLMLPKDYFQSFDLVVVDLSETVMSFQVTSQLSIFQTLGLLLKPEGILLKNGEYYMEKMSTYFDYTLQYFEYDVPFICDQGMVIGSNRIDFFNRTMKDHEVELLVYESQDEINDKFNEFYRFTEYRKNDARKQGQCTSTENHDEAEGKNAGILMVVEAENVKEDLTSSDVIEKKVSDALKNVGFSIESTVKRGSSTFVIVSKEGYVKGRLNPDKSYVGLDIQLWANFDLMEPARDALIQSLGGTEDGTSSFRIVTGGMIGSPFKELDQSKIGPRMVNYRDCQSDSSDLDDGKLVDLKKVGLEGSLEMVEDGVVVAVVCGSEEEACESLDTLKKAPESKLKKVVPVYTCGRMRDHGAEFSPDITKRMGACEMEIVNTLETAGDKISLLVIDNSAKKFTGKVLLSILTSVWNRKRLFAQHRFITFIDSKDPWFRNLLVLVRDKINYKPMSLVDVAVENSKGKSQFSMLSLYDTGFFLHLKEMVKSFNQAHDNTANMEVKQVFDGLPPPQIGHFNPKIFTADAYDPTPAQEQHAGQTSLGRQSLLQFEIKESKTQRKVTGPLLKSALMKSMSEGISAEHDIEFTSFEDNANFGNGLVAVAFSPDGTTEAIVSWDGKTHVDVNLYSTDDSPKLRKKFITFFSKALNCDLTLSDTHPRGIGRVVSFPGHMN